MSPPQKKKKKKSSSKQGTTKQAKPGRAKQSGKHGTKRGTNARAHRGAACPRCEQHRPLFWHGRRELCESCIEECLHPIETSPLTSVTVLRDVVRLAGEVGWRGPALAVLLHAPLALMLLTTELDPFIGTSVYAAIGSMIALGAVTDLGLRCLDDAPLEMGAAIGTAIRRWPALFITHLVAQLVVLIYALLLVVPGVLRYLGYLLITPLLLANDARSVDALEISRQRMLGHRKAAVGPVLACLVPWIAVQGIYLVLRDSGIAAAVVDAANAVVSPIADLPGVYLCVVLHAKLRQPRPSR